MPVKKEDVIAKAKELGIELPEEKINAFVLIGALPTKENSGTPPGDEGDEDEDDLTAGMKDRLRKEKEKRKAMKDDFDKVNKTLKELQDAEAKRQADKEKEKGNWEKLNKDAEEAKKKAEAIAAKAKERFKDSAARSAVESKLIGAGLPASRLSKALKLFDMSVVDFSWTNEETLDHEVEIPDSEIEAFKKDNDFLFEKSEGGEPSSHYQGGKPPKSGAPGGDKNRERIREELSKRGL
jgi:hypothetical protein